MWGIDPDTLTIQDIQDMALIDMDKKTVCSFDGFIGESKSVPTPRSQFDDVMDLENV